MHRLPLLILACSCVHGATVEWWTGYGAQELLPSATRPPQAGETLTLLAPINGTASGQVAVRLDAPPQEFNATCGELSGPAGSLPAGSVQVRYLTNANLAPNGAPAGPAAALTTITRDFVPGPSPLAVAYLTAAIPPGTRAGAYHGMVTVRAGDTPVAVPLTVQVADFAMPARSELDLWVSLMQSPAQLAFAYQAKPYGEEHWRAIEASTRLLGDAGHHVLFVPVLWHANCGTGPQMIVFSREGATLKPDFTRLERYLKLVARECGPQRLLVLGVWGRWLATQDTLHLTGLEPDGSLAPLAWSADYAAHEALWKQVYDGAATLAKQHLGVDPERIVLGFGDDKHPSPATDEVWRRIAPRSPGWEAWTHNYGGVPAQGPRPAFFQIVDTEAPKSVDQLLAWPPALAPVLDGTHAKQPFYLSACRDVQSNASPAVLYYSVPDLAVAPQKMGHCGGIARIGLDFWKKTLQHVDGTTSVGDGYARNGKEGHTDPGRVIRNFRSVLTAQGPTGALPLIHFDALREGIQAAQARITVVQAMTAKPERAPALRSVIERQFQEGARHAVVAGGKRAAIVEVGHATIQSGWSALFAAAGEAQRDLGIRERVEAGAVAEAQRRTPTSPGR